MCASIVGGVAGPVRCSALKLEAPTGAHLSFSISCTLVQTAMKLAAYLTLPSVALQSLCT